MSHVRTATMTRDTAAALLQKLEKIENSDGKKGFNDTEV